MRLFSVTFETITHESAENGDIEDSGFICKDVPLKDALSSLGFGEEGREASDSQIEYARWITAYKTDENYQTGEVENRSIHFPESLTLSTRRRLVKVIVAGKYRGY